MEQIVEAYRQGRAEAGLDPTSGRIAASRPVYVGRSDAEAREEAAAAVSEMVARQRRERPAFADLPMPKDFNEACARVQFVAGGPETVAGIVKELYAQIPFTALHIQPRWKGLPPKSVQTSIQRFQEEVIPRAFAQ
jgi:alkanesulfonate monooxygenase SsuD/methylene tetrahydromethanopterin reductase-like flavin-dependent oxidoreductase (luciferase family)